jgi:hypothetical protein
MARRSEEMENKLPVYVFLVIGLVSFLTTALTGRLRTSSVSVDRAHEPSRFWFLFFFLLALFAFFSVTVIFFL